MPQIRYCIKAEIVLLKYLSAFVWQAGRDDIFDTPGMRDRLDNPSSDTVQVDAEIHHLV